MDSAAKIISYFPRTTFIFISSSILSLQSSGMDLPRAEQMSQFSWSSTTLVAELSALLTLCEHKKEVTKNKIKN
jgi:hypothetical protein